MKYYFLCSLSYLICGLNLVVNSIIVKKFGSEVFRSCMGVRYIIVGIIICFISQVNSKWIIKDKPTSKSIRHIHQIIACAAVTGFIEVGGFIYLNSKSLNYISATYSSIGEQSIALLTFMFGLVFHKINPSWDINKEVKPTNMIFYLCGISLLILNVCGDFDNLLGILLNIASISCLALGGILTKIICHQFDINVKFYGGVSTLSGGILLLIVSCLQGNIPKATNLVIVGCLVYLITGSIITKVLVYTSLPHMNLVLMNMLKILLMVIPIMYNSLILKDNFSLIEILSILLIILGAMPKEYYHRIKSALIIKNSK